MINNENFMPENNIELLAPAGDLEKLKVAFAYGADAVYIGGQTLGLRAKAKNFDDSQMVEAIKFAHDRGKKLFVTANIFAHNDDFEGAEEYFKKLEELGVDALIISDPGIFMIAKEAVPNMEIHISTQANNTNFKSALFWQKLGAKRIVLARELSFKEIAEIKAKAHEMTLESFVHGAMCIAYSGRCLLSNYMTNRDANKGECSHACRWKYNLVEEKRPGQYMPIEEDERGTYIYNSKDLCMIEFIPDLVKSGIESFKIEGRMKTPYYVATVVKAYREAIDDFFKDPELYEKNKERYLEDLKKSSHRDFTTGFYYRKPDGDDQVYTNNSYIRNYDFVGIVLEYDKETGIAKIEQRNKMVTGDKIEIFPAKGNAFDYIVEEMKDESGEVIKEAPHPQQILYMKFPKETVTLNTFDILRKEVID